MSEEIQSSQLCVRRLRVVKKSLDEEGHFSIFFWLPVFIGVVASNLVVVVAAVAIVLPRCRSNRRTARLSHFADAASGRLKSDFCAS